MEQISGMPGFLIRFREDQAVLYPCVDPLRDLAETQKENEVDVFKFKHTPFNDNAQAIQKYFNLHPDTTAHLTAATRRSEFLVRKEYLTITLRYPVFQEDESTFEIFSASLILFPNRLLLIAPDKENNLFDPLLEEFLNGGIAEHGRKVSSLAAALAGTVFRVYTESMETFGDVLNHLESEIIDSDSKAVFSMTALVRKQNIFLQQTILPLKEMSFNMLHAEADIISPDVGNCLHMLSDQIQRVMDSASMLSQINSGLLDIYANAQANRMNEIMRTLTVFSVLTLPVTVISGFYGMNFVFLPGLKWEHAVLCTVAVMGVSILLILWFCRRKHII